MSPADFDFSQYNSPSNTSSNFPLDFEQTQLSVDFIGMPDADSDANASSESAGPPFLWLAIGIGLAAVGIVLGLLLGSNVVVAFIAWFLSGPLAIGAFAVFSLRDTKQRAKPLYGERGSAIWLHRGGLLLALVGVVIASLAIAEWAGRL